jgi:selenium metabolism protein YedF
MSEHKDRKLQERQQESDYYLGLTQSEGFSTQLEPQENLLLLVTAAGIGRGSEELGRLLMKKFFRALSEHGGLGKVIIFLNSGVYLTCAGSSVLEDLCELEKDGAQIFSCATSLEHYQLRELLCIGKILDVYGILDYLQKIPKVIYL